MPTATEKPVKKTQQEFEDPIKQVLTAVDRKVSNLEKKKAKLEGLKQKLAHGDRLEPPQREAIARYDQVIHNLEFAQELQKQFETISSEVERLQKKRLKKERMEKRVMEMRRVQELIELQSLLDSLGSENVRSDLQTGKHGAVVLTEENLKQLDGFYQLICPSREGTGNYREQTMAASVHLVNLLDSSHKEIVGSTYKHIKDLLTLLNNCGYFEKSNPAAEETPEIKQEKEVEEEEESSVASAEKDEQEVESAALDFTEAVEVKLPAPIVESLPEQVPVPVNQDKDNIYDKQPISEPKERPVQDIVTQGNFNFLQDSMLEFDSPHSDPAIVAVQLPNQPMTCPNILQNDGQQSDYRAYNDQSTYDDDGYIGQTEQSWANSSAYVADESLYQDEIMGNQGSSYPSESIDQNQGDDDNNHKKFTMNAKAPVFTSMYNQGENSNSRNNSNQSYQGNHGNDYRSGNRGYNRDNNYRGRNGRNGTDSANQNGYSRGRGGRGGNYQSYQSRNDYRSDSYQGYSNNYNKSGGYQGRGGGSRGGENNANHHDETMEEFFDLDEVFGYHVSDSKDAPSLSNNKLGVKISIQDTTTTTTKPTKNNDVKTDTDDEDAVVISGAGSGSGMDEVENQQKTNETVLTFLDSEGVQLNSGEGKSKEPGDFILTGTTLPSKGIDFQGFH